MSLYVAGGNNKIFVLQIASDGSLTPVPGSPFLADDSTAVGSVIVE